MTERLIAIALGGAFGSVARYLVGEWVAKAVGTGLPYGTLTVNFVGSFLLAAIVRLTATTDLISPTLAFGLTVGVMGGFTTYSTFNQETFRYFEQGAWLQASANILLTVVVCLGAAALGTMLGDTLATSHGAAR